MKEKVTIIGTLNMEAIIGGVNQIPAWGRQIHSQSCCLTPAGSALRVAFPLSHLGAKSYLVGRVGEDIYGKEILQSIKDCGLNCVGVEKSNLQTGLCISLVQEDGQRSLVSFLGSVAGTDEELIWRHYNLIEKTDLLLITGYFNLPGVKKEAWRRILQEAKTAGKHVLLDPGWDVQNWQGSQREEILSLLPFVDTFLPNREEALALSGKNEPEEMSYYLHQAGAKEVIIKLDREGSAGYSPKEGFVKRPALSVKVLDTTAAGETFNAGVVWGLIRGWKLEERLRCANALAGLFISNPERKYPGLEKVKQKMGEENA